MKLVIVLLALVPLAFAVSIPEKRFLLDAFGVELNVLKTTVQTLLNQLGTDATRQACENDCLTMTHLIQNLCPGICRSFQSLVALLNLHPQNTVVQS